MRSELECEYIGLSPDLGLRNFVSTVGENLLDLAPSNSMLKIALRKNNDLISATCRIFSHAGIFEAEAQSERELAAIRKAEEKIRRQLDRWKENRFEMTKFSPQQMGIAV